MSPREEAENRVAEAEALLRRIGVASVVVVMTTFVIGALAVVAPLIVAMSGTAGVQYWQAKRALAALSPPTARLLR